MTKYSIFFIILLLFISCGNPKKEDVKTEEKKTELNKLKYTIFVSSDGFSIYDEKFEAVKKNNFPETIISSSIFEKNLYIMGENLYSVNISNLQTSLIDRIDSKLTNNKLIANRQGVIFISGNNLVFKERSKEQNFLSGDSPITNIWENPYHSYIYCYDSLGYLYVINFQTKTLRRRFFIGKIKSLNFAKFGTRILAVTDKSFLVLDYETLNIIFEKKDFFTDALSLETKDLMFLYSGINRKCWIYSNIDYKRKKDFTTNENDINLYTANDSLMLLFSKEKKTLTLFNRDNKISKKTVKINGILDILYFDGEYAYLKSDSLVFVYALKTDSLKRVGYFPKLLSMHSLTVEKAINVVNADTVKVSKNREVFSIQIYALSNKEYAYKMVEQMKTKIQNENVFVLDTILAGKTIFRVFAGKFESKEGADIFRDDLVKRGFGRDILVKRVIISD
ncbi:MAG: hypothetical protein COX48_02455 [bacterium (Candidatus Stahlbacteria) CG23_combo_of_CG06-09_8_20_14_all_34_7]|nr:MAG: hypothetical protein COX48_02455 [bacterium (Candidatus Stahlbacteria) CG23_combo_of_CG06-09_8_20_14_all_34_7]